MRHPLEGDLTRAGNAGEALRTLILADGEPAERAVIDGTLADLGERLRAVPFRTPALRRAARKLAAAVGVEPAGGVSGDP